MPFHDLEISNVEHPTEESVSVEFSVPTELREKFDFIPGQYLTLRTKIDGEDIRRSYSICSAQGEALRVGIKNVPGGRFSSFAQSLEKGDTLQVMPPEGRFTCTPDNGAQREFMLIAAGSGITPVLSIATSILERESESTVTLIYGNRMTATIMFRSELEALKDRFLERFHLYHVLSREAQDVDMFQGHIDREKIELMSAKGIISPGFADGIYLCGPSAMTFDLTEYFKKAGVDEARIHTELFETGEPKQPVKVSEKAKQAAAEGVDVSVVLDGLKRTFVLADPKDTVLTAAEKSGLELPFSCAGGMCATCRCRIVDGSAEMDKNYSLDKWELEHGFVLACQLRPTSETLTLDFDAA